MKGPVLATEYIQLMVADQARFVAETRDLHDNKKWRKMIKRWRARICDSSRQRIRDHLQQVEPEELPKWVFDNRYRCPDDAPLGPVMFGLVWHTMNFVEARSAELERYNRELHNYTYGTIPRKCWERVLEHIKD